MTGNDNIIPGVMSSLSATNVAELRRQLKAAFEVADQVICSPGFPYSKKVVVRDGYLFVDQGRKYSAFDVPLTNRTAFLLFDEHFRSYRSVYIPSTDGETLEGFTCCHTRQYGCAYSGCKAKTPPTLRLREIGETWRLEDL